ncbi:hypothetical protein [Kribbella sp. VKM Ac-2566]|uniref:hypothetical protein n=1 Tax=Kribbella sp. VKM Ac-2566 TaxID=2512218 RepID=UPI0010637B0D|nr:hypothetical protein [Kribbella sp. VKM Ac-2566]TDX03645.1 hypothetical protein EV647_1890 [Kribbella sp. VKM Ac-2566]
MNQQVSRRFPGTDMSVWLVLVLVALGLPRTVLSDLDVVAPESGLLYYCLALLPFAVWLVVAIARRSRRPFLDFLVVGASYGVSLVIVHQLMWTEGLAVNHIGIAMMIGFGSGLAVGLVGSIANLWRAFSGRRRL